MSATAIPFMTDPEHPPKLSATRIVEAVVIAVVAAVIASMGSSYFTVAAMRVEIDGIKTSMGEVKADVRDLRSVVFRPSWEREAAIRGSPTGASAGTQPRNPDE